jgi:phosphonate metabolism protein PhnN/1,5-bisphosphokinase (PRPP-forming)
MSKGLWVIVCGPSGAGKDSVLQHAERSLESGSRIVFARRFVTRAAGPGARDAELSRGELRKLLASGGVAWHWQAHGQDYAIGAGYRDLVARGSIVVVNGSREHAAGLLGRTDVRTVLVTAPSETVRERLLARGRESTEAVALRMERNAVLDLQDADRVIANDGPLEAAGTALADYLRELAC